MGGREGGRAGERTPRYLEASMAGSDCIGCGATSVMAVGMAGFVVAPHSGLHGPSLASITSDYSSKDPPLRPGPTEPGSCATLDQPVREKKRTTSFPLRGIEPQSGR